MDLLMKGIAVLLLGFLTIIPEIIGSIPSVPLLLVSFDGFRWDYLDLVKKDGSCHTPHFNYFVNTGVTIQNGGVRNAFITKTFPNHFSIVTGMYEENHGVTGNQIYDPKYDKYGSIPLNSSFWFNNGTEDGVGGAEPIWVTNQRSDPSRHSGVYFWPGSEIPLHNVTPTYRYRYDKSVPFEERVDTVVNWLDKKMVNLALLYFNEPDSTGHQHGPDSMDMIKMICHMDGVLGRLHKGLQEVNLLDKVNIILTSDHGMARIYPGQYIDLAKLAPPHFYRVVGEKAVANIFPKEGKTEEVYQALSRGQHMTVYHKESIPRQYHYMYNRRIAPIVAVAEEGWLIIADLSKEHPTENGDHGYNNSLPDMNPIFIARGPAFKKGKAVKQFNIVDIYPLMCHILDVQPYRHDGSLANIKDVLLEPPQNKVLTGSGEQVAHEEQSWWSVLLLTMSVVILFTALLLIVYALGICSWQRWTNRRKTTLPVYMEDEDRQHLLQDENTNNP